MNMIEKITLIIPSHNDRQRLLELLYKVPNWKALPNEIIVVDSSKEKIEIPQSLELSMRTININLVFIYEKNLYPGHARNIGISNSSNTLLAFLDTFTEPSDNWLASGLSIMNKNIYQGVWGKTYYSANSFTPQIIRACTYGAKPIKTFPGSIFKKEVFFRCGLFVEFVRAGEDADWMARTKIQSIKIATPEEHLNYDELNHTSIKMLIKKWFRNYKFSAKLPFYREHKDLYFYAVSFITILIAFNWNQVLASWNTNSIYYIPNITKFSLLGILLIYTFIRGILLPFKKSVKFSFIFPFNIVFVVLLSMTLDLTKFIAFIYAKFKSL